MSQTKSPAREGIPRCLSDGSRLVRSWAYHDTNGTPVLTVGRYSGTAGKTYRPYHHANGSWVPGYVPGPRPIINRRKLDQAQDTENAYVVEGEKCAFAMAALGYLVTTSPGGAMQARNADWSPLGRFHEVRILRDNDPPGERYAADVRDMLAGLPGSRHVETVVLADLPEHGDVCDWIAARLPEWDGLTVIPEEHRLRLRAELDGAINPSPQPAVVEVTGADWPEPMPLYREMEAGEPFPVDALGPILAPAARILHETIQAPIEVGAQSLLAASALAAQPHGNVCPPDGRPIPLSLFCMTVAYSGDRKSTEDKQALHPHREWQKNEMVKYRRLLGEYDNAMEAFETARRNAKGRGGSKKREAIEAELAQQGVAPIKPPEPTLLIQNMTIEGVQRVLRDDWPSIGVFCDEGGAIIGGHSMSRDNLLKTLAEFSQLWDGTGGVRVRGGDGTSPVHGRRVSMHLMVQPEVAQILLGNELAHGQGFLPRFLIAWPKTLRGTRFYKYDNAYNSPEMQAYYRKMENLLYAPLPIADPATRELTPKALTLDNGAMRRYVEFHDTVERENRPGGPLDSIPAWASKAPEHALRMAGVLALVENPDTQTITEEHMGNGVTLATYYLNEMLRLRGESSISPEMLKAGRLLDWLRAQGEPELAAHEIMNRGPFRDSSKMYPLLEILEKHDWVRQVRPTPGKSGRPSKRWRIYQDAS